MADKLSDGELLDRLRDCPAYGQQFAHYKTGDRYVTFGGAIAEATQQPLVIYRPLGGAVTFARPLAEWRELVVWEGKAVERFRAVEG